MKTSPTGDIIPKKTIFFGKIDNFLWKNLAIMRITINFVSTKGIHMTGPQILIAAVIVVFVTRLEIINKNKQLWKKEKYLHSLWVWQW